MPGHGANETHGTRLGVDSSLPGSSVFVTDPAGKTAIGITGVDGSITVGLDPFGSDKYRVQVTPPVGSVLEPAPAGAGLESNGLSSGRPQNRTAAVTSTAPRGRW